MSGEGSAKPVLPVLHSIYMTTEVCIVHIGGWHKYNVIAITVFIKELCIMVD